MDIMDVYPAHPQKFEALGFDLTGLGTLTRTLVPAFSASSRTVSHGPRKTVSQLCPERRRKSAEMAEKSAEVGGNLDKVGELRRIGPLGRLDRGQDEAARDRLLAEWAVVPTSSV